MMICRGVRQCRIEFIDSIDEAMYTFKDVIKDSLIGILTTEL